jgi:hypothetical protein
MMAVARLFASVLCYNALGAGDARRRFARRVFLRTFIFWLLFSPKMGKIAILVMAKFFVSCNRHGPNTLCTVYLLRIKPFFLDRVVRVDPCCLFVS